MLCYFHILGTAQLLMLHQQKRTDLKGSIAILSVTFSVTTPSFLPCSFSATSCSQPKPPFLFLQPAQVKIIKIIYIKKRRYRGYYRNLLPMWVIYVCGQACCIKTKSREPVNIMCFQARCLLSNTLCHLTAVLE